MPQKITFSVLSATSQDNLHKASELINHSPSSKGWQSGNFCLYPQEIAIELCNRSHIKKIQLLSHQHLIATKVEFFIGDCSNSSSSSIMNAKFSRLGYVSLSNNEKTQFKARELKSVHVDAVGRYIKLVIHKNYINKYNHYNQVGIIALNIIGDQVFNAPLEEIENMDFMSRNVIAPTEDLAFDMRVDPETAGIIRKLEKQKLTAVNDEQFDKAQRIKEKISYLTELGEMIGKLEVEKRNAVEKQNYDRAQLKKHQIEQYRYNAYKELDLLEMLDGRDNRFPHNRSSPKPYHAAVQPPPFSERYGDFSAPSQLNNSAVNEILAAEYKPSNEERPLPALANKNADGSPRQDLGGPGDTEQDYGDADALDLEQEDPDTKNVVPGMSKSDISEASDAIDVYGMPLVSKVYSKNWSHREDALLEVKKRLEEMPDDIDKEDLRAEMKAAACVLKKAFKSRMTQVIQVAVEVNQLILGSLVDRLGVGKPELHSYLDRVVPELFKCTGDMKQQIRDLTYPHLVEMSQWECVKSFTHIFHNSIKPFGTSVLAKEGITRNQLLLELYSIHGLCNNQYTLDNFMKYAVTALEHKSAQVRESTETLLIVLYRNEDKQIVRSYLPPDDAKTRKNLLYKRLFEKLDKIDGIEPSPLRNDAPAQEKVAAPPPPPASQRGQVTNRSSRPRPNNDTKADSNNNNGLAVQKKAPTQSGPTGGIETTATPDLANYDETVCIFCGERNEDFVNTIDMHYWKYCPVLRRCPHCKQAVEISLLTQHLLEECEQSAEFKECSRCSEAVAMSEYDQHVADALCNPALPASSALRCPLCHENLPLTADTEAAPESLWQHHLMDEHQGCTQNPRRLVALQRQKQQQQGKNSTSTTGGKATGTKPKSQLPKAKAK